jgi:phosphodiesterase/alkaline phosphatase D-like protein
VTTEEAAAVNDSSATLNASVLPNGSTTTGWFRYATSDPGSCDDSFGTRAPVSGGTDLGSGVSSVPLSEGLSGLSPGTTYYYCAIASSIQGTRFGSVLSFTTTDAPTVTSNSATAVSEAGATLNGSATPNGASTTGWFRYDTVDPGSCNDSFGTRAPSSSGDALGAGSSDAPFSQAVTGLAPSTTYYYCAIAANSVGTRFGAVASFSTQGGPSVSTDAASNIATTTVTLNGSANPNSTNASGWFRYSTVNPGACNNTFGTPTSNSALGSGAGIVPYTASVVGLVQGTTYYYCAIAQNTFGIGYGTVLSFKTLAPPSVSTVAASSIGSTTATLNGSGNPNNLLSSGWFRYDTSNPGTCNDTFGTRAPASAGTDLGSGSSAVPFQEAVTGLSAGTTYYYCAIASNTAGTTLGAVISFTTSGAPTVTTGIASNITGATATIAATANPRLLSTTGWFRYSTSDPGTCDDSFGTRAPASSGTDLGSGSSAAPFSQALSGLSPDTTYYYCAIAENSAGKTFGAVSSFATLQAPVVTTEPATNITHSAASLNGTADPNGTSTSGWFRYATSDPGTCNDSFGTRAPSSGGSAIGNGVDPVSYSRSITGLLPATTYYYCAIAQSSVGTRFGTVGSFITADVPAVTTVAATAVAGVSATLNGTANPNRLATTGWFRYAASNPGTCNDTFGTRAPSSSGAVLGSGTVAVGYEQAITGLTPGATYYYCAIAQNSAGKTFGGVLSLTTIPPPTVTTAAATNVSTTSVTLGGTGNPNGADTTGWVRYAASDPGTCNDSFGTRAPASGGSSLGMGVVGVGYSQGVTGLAPDTTYYYCAIAQSSSGTAVGAVLSFTTLVGPVVTTTAASTVTPTTVTLNGTVNPKGFAGTGWFRYNTVNPGTCNDTFGVRAPAASGTSLGSGSSPVAYHEDVTGLAPSTTYYYCAIASTTIGPGFGTVFSFTTGDPPDATTNAATAVTSTTATLEGAGDPNGTASTGWFRYSTTDPGTCDDSFGMRAPASLGTSLGAGDVSVNYDEDITGLSAGTTYYYCAIVSSTGGTSFGSVGSFTTWGAPQATSLAATAVTAMGATLQGSATTGLDDTTGWFRYSITDPGSCDDSFGTRAPASGGDDLGAGLGSVTFNQALTGLTPATTYYYCAIADNSVGTSFGAVLSFTTQSLTVSPAPDASAPDASAADASGPAASAPDGSSETPATGTNVPFVTTLEATSISADSATLQGIANPNGASTIGWFRYGATNPGVCSDSFGTAIPASADLALGAGSDAVAYDQTPTGLTAATTYYYCAAALNASGTVFGEVMAFTTLAEPSADAPDGGTLDPSAAGSGTAGSSGAAGTDGSGAAPVAESSGCGCRVPRASSTSPMPIGLAALMLMTLLCRRRRTV